MLKFAVAGAVLMFGLPQRAGVAAPRDECVDCPVSTSTTARRSSRKSATSSSLANEAPIDVPAGREERSTAALPRFRLRRLRAAAEVRQPGGRQEGPQHRSFARHQHQDRGAGGHPRQGNQSPRHPQERDPPHRRGPAQPHHHRKRNPLRPARPGRAPRVEFITHNTASVERPDTDHRAGRTPRRHGAAAAAACSATATCRRRSAFAVVRG